MCSHGSRSSGLCSHIALFILQNAVRIFSSENPHHSCCNKKAFFKSLLTTIWLKKFLWHANINWVTYHNTLPSKSLYSGHLDKIIRNLLHCYGWKFWNLYVNIFLSNNFAASRPFGGQNTIVIINSNAWKDRFLST